MKTPGKITGVCCRNRARSILSRLTATAASLGFFQVAILSGAAEPLRFSRMVAHWSDYGGADYLQFIDEAKPEVVQLGFYGAHFWGLADTPYGSGYPAHLPVRG